MKDLLPEVVGWYGVFAIVFAYFLISFGLVDAFSVLYQVLNFSGSLGILIVCVYKRAYQPAVLNALWLVIAVLSLLRLL